MILEDIVILKKFKASMGARDPTPTDSEFFSTELFAMPPVMFQAPHSILITFKPLE